MLISLASSYVVFAVSAVTAFLSLPILLHWLGDVGYGVWVLAASLLTNLTIGTPGIAGSVVRRMATAWGEDNREELMRVSSSGFALYLALAVLVLLGTLAIRAMLPLFVTIGGGMTPAVLDELGMVVLIVGGRMALGIAGQIYQNTLFARRRIPEKHTVRLIAEIATFSLVMGVIVTGGGVVNLAWAHLAAFSAELALCWLLVWRFFGGASLRIGAIDRATCVEVVRVGGWLVLQSGVNLALRNLPIIFLSRFVGMTAVAFFSTNWKLWELGMQLLKKIPAILWPRVSESIGTGDASGIRHNLRLVLAPPVALAAAGCGAGAILIGYIMSAWVGPRWDGGALFNAAIAALAFVRIYQFAVFSALMAAGRVRSMALWGCAEVAVMTALLVYAVPRYGPAGAVGALLAAPLITSAWAWLRELAIVADCGVSQLAMRGVWLSLSGGLPALATAAALRAWLPEANMAALLAILTAASALGLAACWIVGVTAAERQTLLRGIQRRWRGVRGASLRAEEIAA